MKRFCIVTIVLFAITFFGFCQDKTVIWSIGESDNSSKGFCLAPDGYKKILENDFGWEDGRYIIGSSKPSIDWPYILPGPSDTWGGTDVLSGLRPMELNILFSIKKISKNKKAVLTIDILDCSKTNPSHLTININGHIKTVDLKPGSSDEVLTSFESGREQIINIPVDQYLIEGGNTVTIQNTRGSFFAFDQVCLKGEGITLAYNKHSYIRKVKSADYELIQGNKRIQPLLVDIEQIDKTSVLKVLLDNKCILEEKIENGRYLFEAPMPAVKEKKESHYVILINGKKKEEGAVLRYSYPVHSLADFVDTKIGSGHSRWMIAPGPWMPFSMVKLSPDNQNVGWQAGYDPSIANIGGFSHIHEWTMGGFGMLPVQGVVPLCVGDQNYPNSGYRSRIDRSTEKAPLGSYEVLLTDYDIFTRITQTTRASLQAYTYNRPDSNKILIDLYPPAEYRSIIKKAEIKKVDDFSIAGSISYFVPNVWGADAQQDYTLHFVMQFDHEIQSIDSWIDNTIYKNKQKLTLEDKTQAGLQIYFDTKQNNTVMVRTGISFVSQKNAAMNLSKEISDPFGWDFEAVREHNVETWNNYFKRVKITTNNQLERVRFYSNFYRAMARNIFSDVNGEWVDANENVQKIKNPEGVALGCDAFWNTFWNLNQFWNLVIPEWSEKWVNSQLSMYDATGYLAKGPAGMEYIPVMVGEHEIPLIVSAYQMGIKTFDVEKAFEASKKMLTSSPVKIGGGLAGNRDHDVYVKYKYVPYDKGRFSNTLEYSFDDWTLGQFAKALDKESDFQIFNKRGYWWKNVIDKETGYARLRFADGSFKKDFDPLRDGANEEYVEGNAWQLTYFVPQDVPELMKTIGKKRFLERLEWGFQQCEPWRYNSPNEQYWDFPVVQGNQQSMHFAYLFNWGGKPWLTQKWVRSILDRYYGYGKGNAYLGDEDQGQMSGWFVMSAIGLFQTDGGTNVNPIYELASPLYKKIEIDLGERYNRGKKFIIETHNNSRINKYIQKATLNGRVLNSFKFPVSEVLQGGKLELEMGPTPNKKWGLK